MGPKNKHNSHTKNPLIGTSATIILWMISTIFIIVHLLCRRLGLPLDWQFTYSHSCLQILRPSCILSWDFCWKDGWRGWYRNQHQILIQLAWEFIDNDLLKSERVGLDERRFFVTNMTIFPAPPHVTQFENGKWITKTEQEYERYLWRTPGCNKNLQMLHL